MTFSAGRTARQALLPLLLILTPCFASSPSDLEDVLSRMERAEEEVKSLSFRFVQTAHLRVTGENQTIKGEAYFQRPNRFRVEHTAPRSQLVVSDGKTLWLYNPAQQQVMRDSWEHWTASAGFPKGLLPFQMNPSELRKRYTFTLEERLKDGSKEKFVLRLDPTDAGPWPYRVRLWIDGESGIPMRTELESQSVQTMTEITHVKINPRLSAGLFTFKPPRGVEILESPFQ